MGSFRQIDAALALLSALSGTIDGLDSSGKTVPAKDVKLAKREMSTLVYTQLGVLQALGSAMDETFGGIGHVLQAEVLARSQAAKANNANYLARTLHITGTSGSLSAPILAVMQQNASSPQREGGPGQWCPHILLARDGTQGATSNHQLEDQGAPRRGGLLQLWKTWPLRVKLQIKEDDTGTLAVAIATPLPIPLKVAVTISIPFPSLILEEPERGKMKGGGNQKRFPAQCSTANRS